jgi:hypothetical protein
MAISISQSHHSQLKRTDELRKSAEGRESTLAKAYATIGGLLSATEMQIQGQTLHSRVQEVLDGWCAGSVSVR